MGFLERLAGSSDYAKQDLENQARRAQIQEYLAKTAADKAKTTAQPNLDSIFSIPQEVPLRQEREKVMRSIMGAPSVGPLPEPQAKPMYSYEDQAPTDIANVRTQTGISPGMGKLNVDQFKDYASARKSLAEASDSSTNPSKTIEYFNPQTFDRSPTPKPGYYPDTTERINSAIAGRANKDEGKGDKEQAAQDKLEKEFRDSIQKGISNRSGGFGLQDQKVNQAVHLRSLLDQYYDPATGSYNVPASQYEELGIGLANLISGNNTATDSMRKGILQRTAKGDIAGAIAYVTGTTPAASTADVFKNLADSIDRQGVTSELLRNKYLEQIKSRRPSRLAQDRADYLAKSEMGSSYQDYLNDSPSKKGATTGSGIPGKTRSGMGYRVIP